MNNRKCILKRKQLTLEDEVEVENMEKEISAAIADKPFNKHEKIVGALVNNSDGTNCTNVWKELRKSYPKNSKQQ